MSGRLHLWILAVVLVIMAIYGTDWVLAIARLDGILIETTLDPPTVVADGKSSITLTVRVTEQGQPRAHDLLQSWLDTGSGLLIPDWTYTDENGVAQITYSPNPLTQYDVQDKAEIHVRDISIGRLIEVGKDIVVEVPLVEPEEQEQKKIMG
jgi:hypothetical protein